MKMTRFETSVIENTSEGKAFADRYEERLRSQHIFVSRNIFVSQIDGKEEIVICSKYNFNIKDEEVEQDED